jgi:hypothetical protein
MDCMYVGMISVFSILVDRYRPAVSPGKIVGTFPLRCGLFFLVHLFFCDDQGHCVACMNTPGGPLGFSGDWHLLLLILF